VQKADGVYLCGTAESCPALRMSWSCAQPLRPDSSAAPSTSCISQTNCFEPKGKTVRSTAVVLRFVYVARSQPGNVLACANRKLFNPCVMIDSS
jgi:hypothetical protein